MVDSGVVPELDAARAAYERGDYAVAAYLVGGGRARSDADAVLVDARLRLDRDPEGVLRNLRGRRRLFDADGQRAEANLLQAMAATSLRDFATAAMRFAEAHRLARASGDGELLGEIAVARGAAALAAGRRTSAEREASRAQASTSPRVRARGYVLAASVARARGRFHEEGVALVEALREFDGIKRTDVALQAESVERLAALACYLLDDRFEERAVAAFDQIRWPPDLAAVRFHTQRRLAWCRALHGDDFGAFRLLKAAATVRTPLLKAMALLDRAYLASHAGEEQFCAQELYEARESAAAIDWEAAPLVSRMHLLLLAELLFDRDEAEARRIIARFRACAPEAVDDRAAQAAISYWSGVLEARCGNDAQGLEAVRASFLTFNELGFAWCAGRSAMELFRMTGEARWRRTAAEKLAGAGNSWISRELAVAAAAGPLGALTRAQRAVFELLCAGISTREIAQRLGRSPFTVRNHTKAIFVTFGVRSRAALLVAARARGMADVSRAAAR